MSTSLFKGLFSMPLGLRRQVQLEGKRVSRNKDKEQAGKEERDRNYMCRISDTVANREKKRDALMGLEEGWGHGG